MKQRSFFCITLFWLAVLAIPSLSASPGERYKTSVLDALKDLKTEAKLLVERHQQWVKDNKLFSPIDESPQLIGKEFHWEVSMKEMARSMNRARVIFRTAFQEGWTLEDPELKNAAKEFEEVRTSFETCAYWFPRGIDEPELNEEGELESLWMEAFRALMSARGGASKSFVQERLDRIESNLQTVLNDKQREYNLEQHGYYLKTMQEVERLKKEIESLMKNLPH